MAEPMMEEPSSSSPQEEPTTETRSDIKAASDILDARKNAMNDIVAGRGAPYFLTTSPRLANGGWSPRSGVSEQSGCGTYLPQRCLRADELRRLWPSSDAR
jgi:hypothetical protein